MILNLNSKMKPISWHFCSSGIILQGNPLLEINFLFLSKVYMKITLS
jgi:hypothetical protein